MVCAVLYRLCKWSNGSWPSVEGACKKNPAILTVKRSSQSVFLTDISLFCVDWARTVDVNSLPSSCPQPSVNYTVYFVIIQLRFCSAKHFTFEFTCWLLGSSILFFACSETYDVTTFGPRLMLNCNLLFYESCNFVTAFHILLMMPSGL